MVVNPVTINPDQPLADAHALMPPVSHFRNSGSWMARVGGSSAY